MNNYLKLAKYVDKVDKNGEPILHHLKGLSLHKKESIGLCSKAIFPEDLPHIAEVGRILSDQDFRFYVQGIRTRYLVRKDRGFLNAPLYQKDQDD